MALFCLGIILLCRSAPRTNSSTPRHAEWDYPGWWVLSRIKPHRRNLRSFGQLMNPTWSWVITQCSTALELTGCFISLLGDCLIWLGTYHHPCLVLQKEYCLYMKENKKVTHVSSTSNCDREPLPRISSDTAPWWKMEIQSEGLLVCWNSEANLINFKGMPHLE